MRAATVVVLDTNVLVSALGRAGPERRVYRMCRAGRLRMAISPALLRELRRVLRYPKFQFTPNEIRAFQAEILSHAKLVRPSRRVRAIRTDSADNRVLECGVAADASLIISGDAHLLALGKYGRIRIITARGAVETLDLA